MIPEHNDYPNVFPRAAFIHGLIIGFCIAVIWLLLIGA